ncbi:hypothetical protein LK533_07765 [Sphingomonas sp. PL-96]|uniref:ATP-binding protein n=1 Tax=Sphingomonas sp. PL-96 TaxID=2887201 RepID=UPI001E334226|nr:ATP-binding protein [Sphingomonas sp. PL-96]MCC2976570.1 hypothetical protein [Sphingomonas sp. PL-96]
MSDATPGSVKAVGRPLFLRIFALLLGSLLAVQALNVVLVIVTPPPAPRFFSLEQIERALKGGGTEALKRVETDDPGFEQGSARYERRIHDHLATRLRLPSEAVRVRLRDAFGHPRPFRRGPSPREATGTSIAGDFKAAFRQPSGRWVVLQPSGLEIGFWRWRAIATLALAVLLAMPIAWWLSRRIARPIAMFGAAAERLGRDPRSPPMALSSIPEVAHATSAFNEMQAQLQRYVADRSLMLGAVAHDLRTPLMRIALHLEGASPSVRLAVEEEVADMQSMLTAVLTFLRDQEQPARCQRLDLRTVVESVADGLDDEGHPVELEAGPQLVIEGDPVALKSLVSNLMRNAVVHAGGPIRVLLGEDGSTIWLEVQDRGPGIDEALLERMFEPFVRAEASRSRETGGIGLGLASARAVARGHGGDVTLANRPGGGLVARMELSR